MARGPGDPDRDMKIAEVAALIVQHGWTFEAACQLVVIDPEEARARVEVRMSSARELPETPTPVMIQAMCDQLRLASPRPMVGFAIPASAKTREYVTSTKELEFSEKGA